MAIVMKTPVLPQICKKLVDNIPSFQNSKKPGFSRVSDLKDPKTRVSANDPELETLISRDHHQSNDRTICHLSFLRPQRSNYMQNIYGPFQEFLRNHLHLTLALLAKCL